MPSRRAIRAMIMLPRPEDFGMKSGSSRSLRSRITDRAKFSERITSTWLSTEAASKVSLETTDCCGENSCARRVSMSIRAVDW
ncbi:hypothetical protein M6G65_20080 [Methylobacterium tardum]|uniref:hypothetical protein n=1 Tax=Methylobacterium tardum TaxID=374432 RepID=UPI0020221EC5|nr:hypothetical protein [Methylobacterium tardum]URD34860.1 hypothetical protein M6G65_20080 [Methylobacterium tardum]